MGTFGSQPPAGCGHACGRPLCALALLLVTATSRAQSAPSSSSGCAGDCDGDGRVAINELIAGVSIALGDQPLSQCAAFDTSGDGLVAIDEIIAAVDNALGGCVVRATPTPTAMSSATPTLTPTAIGSPQGVELEQRVLRAADGTTYQVVSAVPKLPHTDAASFQLTTLAAAGAAIGAAANPVDGCATSDGGIARAAVGTAEPIAPSAIRRTRILQPTDFAVPQFDVEDSGRLRLGSDAQAVEVCADGSCGEPLTPLTSADDGVPAACQATRAGGFCGAGAAPAAIGFGVSASAGECTDATQPSAAAVICTPSPPDGLRLRPGEQVVFVYAPGRAAFNVGIAGFALAGLTANTPGCAADQVVGAVQLQSASDELPLFRLVQKELTSSLADVAVSADGRHVYLADGGGALSTYERVVGTTSLRRIDVQRDREVSAEGRVVQGLFGAGRLLLSPDGAYLYVISFSSVAIFRRDPEGGRVAFIEAGFLGAPSGGEISPDGQYLYVPQSVSSGIEVLRRDPGTGVASLVEFVSLPGVTGIAVSRDSEFVYAANSVFHRDAQSGRLGPPVQTLPIALGAVAVSGDDSFVYGLGPDGLSRFRRNPQSGVLTASAVLPSSTAGLAGAQTLATSPSGDIVYVGSPSRGTLAVFRGNVDSGGLDPVEVDSVAGARRMAVANDGRTLVVLGGAPHSITLLASDPSGGALTDPGATDGALDDNDLPNGSVFAVAPDGATVYSNDGGLRADRRSPTDGRLQPIATVAGSPATAITVSPDSADVYVAAGDALSVFRRDDVSGAPMLVETQQDGVAGVDGLAGVAAVVASSDGKHVYAAGAGDDAVAAFSRDSSNGALQFLQALHADADFAFDAPDSLVLSPDGAFLYVVGNELVILQRDASTGLLSGVTMTPRVVLGAGATVGVTGDGRHLYVSNPRPAHELQIYRRDLPSGALTFLESAPSPSPIFTNLPLTLSPDGAYLFLPDVGVTVFSRDLLSGAVSHYAPDDIPTSATEQVFTGVGVSPDSRNLYANRQVYRRAP
jgi:6-phosphogluconolactonase (cycloisomerase 2 family)